MLLSGLMEEMEPDGSLHEENSVTCRRTTKSQRCFGNTAVVLNRPAVRSRSCTARNRLKKNKHETENVLMDADDFVQEVTVVSEHWPIPD